MKKKRKGGGIQYVNFQNNKRNGETDPANHDRLAYLGEALISEIEYVKERNEYIRSLCRR